PRRRRPVRTSHLAGTPPGRTAAARRRCAAERPARILRPPGPSMIQIALLTAFVMRASPPILGCGPGGAERLFGAPGEGAERGSAEALLAPSIAKTGLWSPA